MTETSKGDGPLIVLGMHRSGTSLVSHWLHSCGVFLGDDLFGASPFNLGGYFEDVAFLRLHEALLRELGQHSSGHELPLERQKAPTPEMVLSLAAFVDARRRKTAWGWKDPRSCLLLDLYHKACPDARYLVVIRDFIPIVHSLVRRERALQSRWIRLARGKLLNKVLYRYFERRFTDHYLNVVSLYFESLLTHLSICPNRCAVLDLDRFVTSAEPLVHELARLGVTLDPVPVKDVFRPAELSDRRDLIYATPALLARVKQQYMDLKAMAV